MRVFVTGASGFIGAHVLRALLRAGHEVAVLALPGDTLQRVCDLRERFRVVLGALADTESWSAALAAWHPEACIHLAWYAEPGKYLQASENLQCLRDSLALVQEMTRVGCGVFVGAGTCAEYDTDRGFLREDGPARPATLYAATKLSCGVVGERLATQTGMRFVWTRIFLPYGPAEDPRRVVPALIRALRAGESFAATSGEQVRDYLHVEDVAAAFVKLIEAPVSISGVINVASGVPITVRRLLEIVGELLGRQELIEFGALPYRNWEPRFICGDPGKLIGLGWQPRYELREGLRQTIEWWQRVQP